MWLGPSPSWASNVWSPGGGGAWSISMVDGGWWMVVGWWMDGGWMIVQAGSLEKSQAHGTAHGEGRISTPLSNEAMSKTWKVLPGI